MSSFEEKLKDWMICETSGLCEGRLKKLPDFSSLSTLTEGKNKKIWKYVVDHVKSRATVCHVKEILQLRRNQREGFQFNSSLNLNNNSAIKREIIKAEDKLQYLEPTYLNSKKDVFTLKESIKILNEKNCVFTQKCSILETAALNYQEKNMMLKGLVEKLVSVFKVTLSSSKTHFPPTNGDKESDHLKVLKKVNNDSVYEKIKNVVYLTSLTLENKFFHENENVSDLNLIKLTLEIMEEIHRVDLIKNLIEFSEKSVHEFENLSCGSDTSCVVKNNSNECKNYLHSMKLDHINSRFHREVMTKELSEILQIHEILPMGEFERKEQEYVFLKIHNECLKKCNGYLKDTFSKELDRKIQIFFQNGKRESTCQDLKAFKQEFFQRLESLHFLLNTSSLIFSNIKEMLVTSYNFSHNVIFNTINSKSVTLILDFPSVLQEDNNFSFNLLKQQNIFKDLLSDYSFEIQNAYSNIWEIFRVELFQNHHLFCEKLVQLKKESSMIVKKFNSFDSHKGEDFFQAIFILSNMIEKLQKAEKDLNTDAEQNCKVLKTLLDDWWEQKAQFIPKIKYKGKTLEMWLSILCVLEYTSKKFN